MATPGGLVTEQPYPILCKHGIITRTSNNKVSNTKVKWPDFWASDYIWRSKELQYISAYEYVKEYERKTLGKNERGQTNNQDAMTSPDNQRTRKEQRKKKKQDSTFFHLMRAINIFTLKKELDLLYQRSCTIKGTGQILKVQSCIDHLVGFQVLQQIMHERDTQKW